MILSSFLCSHVCYLCGMPLRGDRSLCSVCAANLAANRDEGSQSCPRCSFPFFPEEQECAFCPLLPPELDSLAALFRFSGVHRELLYLYKTGKMKNLRYFYARELHRRIRRDILSGRPAAEGVIVPVPPRKGKLRKQGWDQVLLLCATLHRLYGYPVAPVLERTDSLQQKSLNLEERRSHLRHAIRFRENRKAALESPGYVILLDDVFTTGATLASCASVLKQHCDLLVAGAVLCSVL